MQQDYSDPDSIREQHETYHRWEQTRRRHRLFGVVAVLLALGLIGLAWFIYPRLNRQDRTLARLPRIQTAIDKMAAQLKAADSKVDSKLADWSSRHEDLRQRIDKSARDMKARIESAQKQASDASAALFERVQSQVANQVDNLKTRMAAIETSRENDQAQIARLQQDLNQVRGQMAEQANKLEAVRGEVDQNAAISETQVAGLKETRESDRHDLDTLTNRVTVRRVDFEVSKDQSREVAPGISLGVDGTDVSYQRVSGWVWLMPGRKTIRLRQQKAEDPLVIASTEDGRKSELVITSVGPSSVAGYLLMPAPDGSTVN